MIRAFLILLVFSPIGCCYDPCLYQSRRYTASYVEMAGGYAADCIPYSMHREVEAVKKPSNDRIGELETDVALLRGDVKKTRSDVATVKKSVSNVEKQQKRNEKQIDELIELVKDRLPKSD